MGRFVFGGGLHPCNFKPPENWHSEAELSFRSAASRARNLLFRRQNQIPRRQSRLRNDKVFSSTSFTSISHRDWRAHPFDVYPYLPAGDRITAATRMNKIDLTNRHAVVTGGAQGIGLSIAQRFLSSGASVTLWDRDRELLAATVKDLESHGTVDAVTADVTNADAVSKAAAATAEKLGKIDILVANAGISGPDLKTWEYSVETWNQIIDVDLTGVFLCCRAVVPFMLQQKYGRIVNVSSIAGKEGNPNASAYSAAKAGVIALTKSLGKELADRNIAVNCITPAAARTRIFEQISQEHIDYMLSKIPRGRFLEVNEIASMVAWLVSEENSFTTGAVFDLSGGRATY
jgi:2-dehydro-3-deoxy-L-rhamnonate dehydrogenase (NAD+)